MNQSLWWTPYALAAGSLLIQGVVAWAFLQVTRAEVQRLRKRSHDHAGELQILKTTQAVHERELSRIRDRLDRNTENRR